jgi:hypothetical protein
MKTATFRLLLVLFATLTASQLIIGCDALSGSDSGKGVVTLTGQILNNSSNNPLDGAFVRILPLDLLFETDADGRYTAAVTIDSTMDLQVNATRDGFFSASVTVLALAGRTIEVPTLRLSPSVTEEATSGLASNILLLKQSATSIGVKESGSVEVAELEFMVADSAGRAVVLDNSTLVRFMLGVQPGGGEFISPSESKTDNNGVAKVNLSSGTRAGVVQIVAETTVNGRTVRSLPVAVSIHGGLPDQTHFSIGPSRFNFPGLLGLGITNPIGVIVGDKYSNPVRQGTAVYFSSTHGVIEGSVQTDEQGQGAVNLISANPLPADGIALITAGTADDSQATVSGSTPVVFSGFPVVRVSPAIALINQTYSMTVTDQNGNPLAAGTNINVKVEGTAVKAVGNTGVELDDTVFSGGVLYENVVRGPGITEFTFRAVEDIQPNSTATSVVEAVTITLTGPNGKLEIVLGPSSAPVSPTEGADLKIESDGTLIARAPYAIR